MGGNSKTSKGEFVPADVAVVGFAQTKATRRESLRNETEMVMEVIAGAFAQAGLAERRADVVYSGSSDYLSGLPFSFVFAFDAVGGWPPARESHVEMDGAFALYEAWTRLVAGDGETALVYSFGKSSTGDVGDVLTLQLDPYCLGQLWPDPASLAALQARAFLESSGLSESALAEVVARNRRAAMDNPYAQVTGQFDAEKLLLEPYCCSPLRRHDLPPISDGAAAVILASGDTARRLCEKSGRTPAWIRGIDHRIEAHAPGVRQLDRSTSTALAAQKAAERAKFSANEVDVAELHAPFSHDELILSRALQLTDKTRVNPSGGALAANPIMATGLIRLGEAATQVLDGGAKRSLGHATSGPCLQQNLVCLFSNEAGGEVN